MLKSDPTGSACEPDVAGWCLHSHKDRLMQSKRELFYNVQYLVSLPASQLIPHDQRKYVGHFAAVVCWLGKLCCLVLVWVEDRDQNCWWNTLGQSRSSRWPSWVSRSTQSVRTGGSQRNLKRWNAVSLPANVLALGVLFRRCHILHKQGFPELKLQKALHF